MPTTKNIQATIILLTLFFLFTANTQAETNHCWEEESEQQWNDLTKKYPNDMNIQTLHALRIGLYTKIELGDLTIDQATEIFERARLILIQEKRMKKEKGKKDVM